MKTIFSGNITITTSKEDGEYTATAEWNGKGITSSKTNREGYQAQASLFQPEEIRQEKQIELI